jgi:hypothetical protein
MAAGGKNAGSMEPVKGTLTISRWNANREPFNGISIEVRDGEIIER